MRRNRRGSIHEVRIANLAERLSGYDAATGICWRFGNKGDRDWNCGCPVCGFYRSGGESGARPTLAFFGRCRSGQRWFWVAAFGLNEKLTEGFADTEDEAWRHIIAAVHSAGDGRPMSATLHHDQAYCRLKEINEAKRRARPAPDTSESRPVEYLYSRDRCDSDGMPCGCETLTGTAKWRYHIHKFQITKKTKRRIFYARQPLPLDETNDHSGAALDMTRRGVGSVDRNEIESKGEIWTRKTWQDDWRLYLAIPEPKVDADEPTEDLRALKAAMADAHPDRGGTNEGFIEARRRYETAKHRQKNMEVR